MRRTIAAWSVTLAAMGLLGALAIAARAEVKPNVLFSDGAVLQRGMRVPVWGTATDGEAVTVSFQGQHVSTTAAGGQWKVILEPLKTGGPYSLTIQGTNTVTIKNVLVGEVWIASGQSNMELPLFVTVNAEADISESKDPRFHLFTVPKKTSEFPLTEVGGSWSQAGPTTVGNFSAVAYFFGRELRQKLNVPVGIIHTSWGGTLCEAWTKESKLASTPALSSILTDWDRVERNYVHALAEFPEKSHDARLAGNTPPKPPANPRNPGNPNRPAVLYNAMIAPLIPYAIRGAIWYQGESNADRAYQYQTLFPAMIESWREAWGEGNFPFEFVQLAPFLAINPDHYEEDSAWAELREAQRLTRLHTPNTGMAVITDVGAEKDIHPKFKEPVGQRLAYEALANVYGRGNVPAGPAYSSFEAKGDKIVLHFKNVGLGLVAHGDDLTGFAIAGSDGTFVNADAEIKGDTVVVSSPRVSHPVAVRYGWANYPVDNLFNADGIPATPFRTDSYKMRTQP